MTWKIDSAHSQLEFSVRHLMITNVRGQFQKFDGTIDFDENHLDKANINVQIEAASIYTRDANRDGHLRSPDFLDAEKFPTLTFKSTNVKLTGAKTGQVTGDLTIRGETHPVTLDVEFVGIMKTPFGQTNAGFNAHTKLNRKDWGLVWNVGLETGGVLVGDEVTVNIEVELVKVEEAQPAAAQ